MKTKKPKPLTPDQKIEALEARILALEAALTRSSGSPMLGMLRLMYEPQERFLTASTILDKFEEVYKFLKVRPVTTAKNTKLKRLK